MKANARLRGWQRTTTKLKYNNCNHRGSLDWKRHALTVPLEAFVRCPSSLFLLAPFRANSG
ncbi:hypothetical protein FXE83_07295 [Vibrio cholerae]|nr:hypothetical protein FXE83_07295 [Vibrio cholerae]